MAPYARNVAALESIPVELRDLPIWCAWKLVPGKPKPDKIPVSPLTGRSEGWTGAGFCVTATEAITYATNNPALNGIGLMVGDGISGGDLDGCIADPARQVHAQGILAAAGTYTEISPGQDGYRFIFAGTFGGHTGNKKVDGVEFYEDNRFLTFTGQHVPTTPTTVEKRDLSDLGARHFCWMKKGDTGSSPAPENHRHVAINGLSDALQARITGGAPKGERSEAMLAVAKDMMHSGMSDEDICCVLADKAYGISSKALENRKKVKSAMAWAMKYAVAPARRQITAEMAEIGAGFGPAQQPQQSPADIELPWDEPVDMFDESIIVPAYTTGQHPAVYEAFAETNYRHYRRSSREAYAGLFVLSVACNLRPSVQVEETPNDGKGVLRIINEEVGLAGQSGRAKTDTLFHAIDAEPDCGIDKWNKFEQSRILKIREERIDKVMEAHKGDVQGIKALVAEIKSETAIPNIVHSSGSDKWIVARIAENHAVDLPMNLIIDEWGNVYGGSDYRGDRGMSMMDVHRKMYDGKPYSSGSTGSGEVRADRMCGNLGYDCTAADMSTWQSYQLALTNGTFARQSLFAPGKAYAGKSEPIDWQAIQAWREVQRKLRELEHLTLILEPDPEFDNRADDEIADFTAMADNGNHVAFWLCKSKLRVARYAAAAFLVDEMVAGTVLKGSATIPMRYRRKAWNYLMGFAWSHQVFVHDKLIAGESYKSAMSAILGRIMANGKKEISRDELIGSKSPKSIRRNDEEFIKMLIYGFHWIRPIKKHKFFDERKPWTAFSFEVNPQIAVAYEKHAERILAEYEAGKGLIASRFAV